MPKEIRTIDGDTIDGVLYQHLGDYSAKTEDSFYKLNPNVARIGAVLPAGVTLIIPDPIVEQSSERLSVWD
ncbi:tail protein X [Pseudoalteromonas sp. MMG024]|uniref:tail protein X n=1 Tax=Pseudoalteromonas sp. MMG024 TaxID=2909980 RepID=UPI001F15988E|nr:tail protein X [Pseudoalteromonas sp. MMG024]MCF6459106.1 tail protein X [Pseudoalteromonas sp. MMG024]